MFMTNTKKRAHVLIHGSVQGIGYRFFAVRTAREMGLAGWVKNLPTGEVELEVEGESQILENYLQYLQTKHPWANVHDVEVTWLSYEGKFQNFEISYG